MKILTWQEGLHLLRTGKFKPWLHLKLRLQGTQNGLTLKYSFPCTKAANVFFYAYMKSRAWFEDTPNTTRRLLNWCYFSFAAIRSRSKNSSSWSIRFGFVWKIFSNKQTKKTIGAVVRVLHRTNSRVSSRAWDHVYEITVWFDGKYKAASFKLQLFSICCNSITEQKQLIMVHKMWSRVKNIFKRKESNYWSRHIFSIPCPEEVYICTELTSGLGRRLPCYNTNQHIIIVREEISSNLQDQQDHTVEGNGDRALRSMETRS